MGDRLLRRTTGFAAVLASMGVGLLAIGIAVDVTLRYVAGTGVPGMIEYVATLMVAVVFLGLAQGQRRGEHVGMSFVVDRLPPVARYSARLVGLVCMALLIVWMTVETADAALRSYQTGEFRFGLLRVPLWPSKVSIPIGLILLLAETLRSVVREAQRLRNGEPPSAPAVGPSL